MNLMAKPSRVLSLHACVLLNVILLGVGVTDVKAFYVNTAADERVLSLLRRLRQFADPVYTVEETDIYGPQQPSILEDIISSSAGAAGVGTPDIYEQNFRQEATRRENDKHVNEPSAIKVNKRYTEAQNTAQDFCTGQCMYMERLPYSKCYGLCHWTGAGPSPWIAYYKEKSNQQKHYHQHQQQQQRSGELYRTGLDSRIRDKGRRLKMIPKSPVISNSNGSSSESSHVSSKSQNYSSNKKVKNKNDNSKSSRSGLTGKQQQQRGSRCSCEKS